MTLALLFGTVIGISLGLLGGGGSIITVPVLVYAAGVPVNEAVGMSLVVVGGASIFGSLMKLRHGLVHLKAAFLFSIAGIVGALIGAQFTRLIPSVLLLLSFAALMTVVALLMLRQKPESDLKPAPECNLARCVMVGAGVGLLTGLLGVGGGFLIVPALMVYARLPLKMAIGTSLVVITVNSVAGFIGHLKHIQFDWKLTGLFLAVALTGMLLGTQLSSHISTVRLQKGFAWFVLAVAAFVVAKNLNIIGMG